MKVKKKIQNLIFQSGTSSKQTMTLTKFYLRLPINIWQCFVMPEMMQKKSYNLSFF